MTNQRVNDMAARACGIAPAKTDVREFIKPNGKMDRSAYLANRLGSDPFPGSEDDIDEGEG